MPESDLLRFPVGHFTPPAGITPALRADQIATLRQLPAKLREAVAGLNDAQLDTPYREGGWNSRQVVHHVADSHANSFIRFKLALTEDWPTIKAYDEAAWAELADSRTLPVAISLQLLDGLHTRWVAVVESMREADFEKGYIHPKMGRQTLSQALALYAWHSRHHTAHITGLRARMGW
jgi:uncharacterized damage-inducible protein DinB